MMSRIENFDLFLSTMFFISVYPEDRERVCVCDEEGGGLLFSQICENLLSRTDINTRIWGEHKIIL